MMARLLPVYEQVGDTELAEAVHQALGVASVCWEPVDCTGVFDEATARQAGAELLEIITRYRGGASDQALPGPPGSTEDLTERAWGLIANAGWDAGSGDVTLAKTAGWHDAAIRWRDDYHASMRRP
jgi:hypothetical protein